MRKLILLLFNIACCLALPLVQAEDWPRFRGPSGSGIARASDALPSTWSATENLAWRSTLPGPGASSPIIVGNRVLVTCYSGYGLDAKAAGNIENLVRHLICLDLNSGETLWHQRVKAWLPEDAYDSTGVSSHGYASHTPVSDGNNVYAFFGKGGVHAFRLDNGQPLWHVDAGTESDPPKWGSSSSPIVFEDKVIVTASAESQSIIALEKGSGRILWQQEATGLDGMWGTPTLVRVDDQRTDLVMLVAGELWGLNPDDGQLRWYRKATESKQAYTSVIADRNTVFAFSGQGGGSVALRLGSVSGKPEFRWRGPTIATYASPVQHQDKIYVVSRGILTAVNSLTGKPLERVRLPGAKKLGNARFGSLDYASPVVIGDRLFYLNASGQTFVFRLGPKLEQVSVNELNSGGEVFWASPAVSQDRLILRSSKYLYCISRHAGQPKINDLAPPSGEILRPRRDAVTGRNEKPERPLRPSYLED